MSCHVQEESARLDCLERPPGPANPGPRAGREKKGGIPFRTKWRSSAIIALFTLFLPLIFPSGLLAELSASRMGKVCPSPS
jgi:hypothetical protein